MQKYRANNLKVDFYPSYIPNPEELFDYFEAHTEWSKKVTPGRRVNRNYGDDVVFYELNFSFSKKRLAKQAGGYGGKELKTIRRDVISWDNLPLLEQIKNELAVFTDIDYELRRSGLRSKLTIV